MSDIPVFKTGEATVFASNDQGTDAMPEVVLGALNGPVGNAFATLMGQTEGHTRLFAIRACNQQVKPATLMVPKVTMKSTAYINLFFGVVQSAIADAVIDSVIDGVIPKDWANEVGIIVNVWLDPWCAEQENPDKKDLYRTNYEATKLAIKRAINDEPTIEELIENRNKIHHEMYDPVTGESKW
ncbi:MAG: aldehyde-activating protein [Methylothermaceae bacteria B42]|nr:MAG: aldehyde-activating protein [Methylothermaceae bacteria B42]HHJ38303.1 formaldehyde-activating enzyme [Methylothermaceae bacterium]